MDCIWRFNSITSLVICGDVMLHNGGGDSIWIATFQISTASLTSLWGKANIMRYGMNKSKIKQSKIPKLIALFISLLLFCIWQNNDIVITEITYNNPNIPKEFNGYKIIHVSDLHNKTFGEDQRKLMRKIEQTSPDIILVTGDIIDRRKYNLDAAMMFIDNAINIAPIYYVSGNHEAWSGEYDIIKHRLINSGVRILDDYKTKIAKDGADIELIGLSDPDFLTNNYIEGTDSTRLENQLSRLSTDPGFKILLSHRPELFDIYANENIDLIFSGHAHGGQFRIPGIGGLVAPDQGLFPKYTNGVYKQGQSSLIVSRGLGNSIIPVRVFNRPELIAVTLQQMNY